LATFQQILEKACPTKQIHEEAGQEQEGGPEQQLPY